MTAAEVGEAIRAWCLAQPEVTEEFPWGERVMKVKGKVFVFMGMPEEGGLGMSVKLPVSGDEALALPYAKRTGYNLGKYGWVSFRFAPADQPDLALLLGYVEESWRAVAPKRLLKASARTVRPPG